MEIKQYDFKKNPQISYLRMLECQSIIDDNLVLNGGTLKQEDLLLQIFDWQYLLTANIDGKPVGFSLLRKSHEDKHNTGYNEYYYISVIAVYKNAQRQGIGTELLTKTLTLPLSLPIVASCRKDNEISKHFLSSNMTKYDDTRRYHRFLDNKTYHEKYGTKKSMI